MQQAGVQLHALLELVLPAPWLLRQHRPSYSRPCCQNCAARALPRVMAVTTRTHQTPTPLSTTYRSRTRALCAKMPAHSSSQQPSSQSHTRQRGSTHACCWKTGARRTRPCNAMCAMACAQWRAECCGCHCWHAGASVARATPKCCPTKGAKTAGLRGPPRVRPRRKNPSAAIRGAAPRCVVHKRVTKNTTRRRAHTAAAAAADSSTISDGNAALLAAWLGRRRCRRHHLRRPRPPASPDNASLSQAPPWRCHSRAWGDKRTHNRRRPRKSIAKHHPMRRGLRARNALSAQAREAGAAASRVRARGAGAGAA